jgi:hypothetical protein
LHQTLSIDFEADEIDQVRNFIRFNAKRLRCTEDKVFVELAKEFERSQKIFDYKKEQEKENARASTKTGKAKATEAT